MFGSTKWSRPRVGPAAKRLTYKRIVLIDGEQLAALMYDYGIGVATTATYAVKRVDPDYFGEE